MTAASIDPLAKQLILELLIDGPLLPTEMLEKLLAKQLTPTQIQDNLALLLDTGELEMGVDRRLHIVKVPA